MYKRQVKDLRPYIESNPYKEELAKAGELVESYHELLPGHTDRKLKLEDAVDLIHALDSELKALTDKKSGLVEQRDELQASKDKVAPFNGLNYDVKKILGFRFMKFRFGRISREYYEKFYAYVYDSIDTDVYKRQSIFFPYSTVPVSASMTIPPSACMETSEGHSGAASALMVKTPMDRQRQRNNEKNRFIQQSPII